MVRILKCRVMFCIEKTTDIIASEVTRQHWMKAKNKVRDNQTSKNSNVKVSEDKNNAAILERW